MSRQQESFANNDRRLRPIFDWLDNGCNKKALSETDKLLKKNKDSQYIKVLKSLTLIRLARKKEAAEILAEVHNEMPCEDSVLQTMSMCYREIQRNDLIVSIYENALKKDPTNEKLHTHLFMAHVRLQDYKKQRLTALNLYKNHLKNPYYFWAVMSIYMQAITSEDEASASTSNIELALAEKMCEKFYKENKFDTEAEYELYLMILEKQKKYSKMIDLMEELERKKKLRDHFNFLLHRKVGILRNKDRLIEAFDCLQKLIKTNNDQYNYYIEAFEVATSLDDQQILEKNGENQQQSTPSYKIQLLELIEKMCSEKRTTIWSLSFEKSSEDNSLNETVAKRCPRGPFMARIIILNRLKKCNLKNETNNYIEEYLCKYTLNDLIYEYYVQFGSKFVCIKDLIYIFQNIDLTVEQIQELVMKIKCNLMNLDEKDYINMSLCYHYLEFYNKQNFGESFNSRLIESQTLFDLYKRNKANLDKDPNIAIKDQPPFDPFIYLFILNIFADANIYTNDPMLSSFLFNAIVFLECYQLTNKPDFYTKLLLVCLYNATGAATSSHSLCESLEIKLIQNDTLGFHFLPSFLHCALYSQASQFLDISSKFYNYNFKEAYDYITSGYKNGQFSKIVEIIQFNQKLHNSIQHYYIEIENLFMELLVECKNEATFNNFIEDSQTLLNSNLDVDWEKICDNRDLSLLNSNHHRINSSILNEIKSKTFDQDKLWLRFRFTLLTSLIVGVHLSRKLFVDESNSTDNEENLQSNVVDNEKLTLNSFENLIKDLKQIVESCELNVKDKINYYLVGPSPSRLITFFDGKNHRLILLLLDHLLILLRFASNHSFYDFETKINSSNQLFDEITKNIENLNQLKSNTTLKGVYKMFGEMSTLVEVLSISVLLLGVVENNVKKLSKSNKKSKKKNTQQFKECEEFLTKFNNHLSAAENNLDKYFKTFSTLLADLCDNNFADNIVSKLEYKFPVKFENFESMVETVKKNLTSSYNNSLMEMKTIVQSKHRYLSWQQ